MKSIEYEKSFASHQKAIYWSNKNEGKPENYALNSHKKFWFNCDKCEHDFESKLLNINQSNTWCPYCSNQKICSKPECNMCFNKSFASHPKSIHWSNKNILTPREVFKSADRKQYYFNCYCNHELQMIPKNISSKAHWCSYCAHKTLCKDNDCKMCYNNSFASIEKSKYLTDKTINPRFLFKSTNKKYEFCCDKCNNSFSCILSDVTNGVWCSKCYNKTEEKLYIHLSCHFIIKRQYKPLWCINQNTNKHLPFDFVIEELKIIIEQDGPQHFKQVGNWQSPELTRINDIYKMRCANENGFSVIRILQKDIFYDKYDWLNELLLNITQIQKENMVQNIYMCKKDEYKDFDKLL